jgi:hypothetical protein
MIVKCIPNAMDVRKDKEGAGNYGSDHKSVSSKCERDDGDW